MYLKGSYTVEAAYIVPLYLLVLVLAIKIGISSYNEARDRECLLAEGKWEVSEFYKIQMIEEVISEFKDDQ